MNSTPRLRSAFPSTPRSNQRDGRGSNGPGPASGAFTASQTGTKGLEEDLDAPLIPLNILDGPSQRLSVLIFYFGLTTWRFYDFYSLVSSESDSLWLFMKWVAIDVTFLFGLPALRIPWLEWSSTVMTVLFLVHAISNAILMFRIPIPLEAWLAALTKTIYDRELAVSERRVKPASILHNSSLILGKQIIHILPEGSAMLNPEQDAFCIDNSRSTVNLPIRINQTNPILIELLRIDLDTNLNETITISSKEARKLKKQADKVVGKKDVAAPRLLRVPVTKTGLYRLQRVVDESNLEVQRRISDTLVVRCPSASVKPAPQHKCFGDLSNFYFQVDATPPLKIKYSKTINQEDSSHVFLTVHPENLESPLSRQKASGALVKLESRRNIDVSWARTQHIEIPVNETLGTKGIWQYSIDEVHDACGNVVKFPGLEESASARYPKSLHLDQMFIVHEAPKAVLATCSTEQPLRVARGDSINLPIILSGGERDKSPRYHVSYDFVPETRASADEDKAVVRRVDLVLKRSSQNTNVSDPGLYSLRSVATDYCSGEVMEPSSCVLLNPPEPDLTIASDTMTDVCAGNSIGLLVDIDLVGTPPFTIYYNVRRGAGPPEKKYKNVHDMRDQLELRPQEAGHYTYEFLEIQDAVYEIQSLKHKNLVLEQDVRPPAWARFQDIFAAKSACIEERSYYGVRLSGQAPWTLEYDMLHGKKRKKYKVDAIKETLYQIETEKITEGGDYLLSLTGVTDASGCKVLLDEIMRIKAHHYRPEAAFGSISGRQSVLALEGKKVNLPLRLTGDAPWEITYKRLGDLKEAPHTLEFSQPNGAIQGISKPGVYQIMSVRDRDCPGTVDTSASQFEVSWIERPTVKVVENLGLESMGGKMSKKPVCEGDQDAMELSFGGSPPFEIGYEVHLKPQRGSASVSKRKEIAGLNAASIKMETSQAGLCEYKFTELGDQSYEHDRRTFKPLTVQQTIHSRPSATFNNIGKTYRYCKEEEAGVEVIPVSLVGQPPFSLEIGIRHHATTKPEIMSIPNINARTYNFHIPHRVLALGNHAVTIRKVRDSNGCERATEFNSPAVQVNVVDIPSISPQEATTDYCVGDRISYALAGTPPFNVYYVFNGVERKATASSTSFRRIAEKPGEFTVTGLSDKASTDACIARFSITKTIHQLPSVRISKGRTAEVDIHEGGEADLVFEFGGTPPFKFTYTRSTNEAKGKKSIVLETKNEVSHEHSKSIKVSEEGTYEVVSIRDRYCGFSSQQAQGMSRQQLLTFR